MCVHVRLLDDELSWGLSEMKPKVFYPHQLRVVATKAHVYCSILHLRDPWHVNSRLAYADTKQFKTERTKELASSSSSSSPGGSSSSPGQPPSVAAGGAVPAAGVSSTPHPTNPPPRSYGALSILCAQLMKQAQAARVPVDMHYEAPKEHRHNPRVQFLLRELRSHGVVLRLP